MRRGDRAIRPSLYMSRVWSNSHVKRYRSRDSPVQDVATVEEFFEEIENENTSAADSEPISESDSEDSDSVMSQAPARALPSSGSPRVRYTPRIVNHLQRGGTVWYYVQSDPGAPPVFCSREQAAQANAEALHHYARLYLGKLA